MALVSGCDRFVDRAMASTIGLKDHIEQHGWKAPMRDIIEGEILFNLVKWRKWRDDIRIPTIPKKKFRSKQP